MTDIWSDLARRRELHMRLFRACERVMLAGDLTEQAVAEALGRPAGVSLFDLYAETAVLVANAGMLVALSHARWGDFGKPPELVAAIDEVLAAIQELPSE